jgi:nucleotide-binding universal stress UspA family protein
VNLLCWIVEGTWPACVAAVRDLAPPDAEVTLLHVTGPDLPAVVHGARSGLFGRGRHRDDDVDRVAASAAADLLAAAAQRLGGPARQLERHGRAEHEVTAAAADADLLVLARDGDLAHPGPHSLGPHTRYVVDHAPCPVLLVWPDPPR